MEETAIRMKAYAMNFNEIRVRLSKDYYQGISSKFYLKDLEDDELLLLKGDAVDNQNHPDYQEYVFHISFKVGRLYKIIDEYGLSCFLDFSELSLCPEFDDLYYYEGDDLGSSYTKESTTFKVWAPLATGVVLHILKEGEEQLYSMKRGLKGVYSYTVHEDLDHAQYLYFVKHNSEYIITLDPYAYASTSNGHSSLVVDLNKIECPDYQLPPLLHKTDAIIYETSVRDFSMSSSSDMEHRGKFLAFTEHGTATDSGYPTGIDYLKRLGITHLQLMPINDFATVDEKNVLELYNWGYDPSQYNVPEGSYITDPNDGYKRILETKQMISALHREGIRVVLDVVYNHMHDVNFNALERTVPHYFFRRNEDGTLSNGSWCGNDLNTTAKMCQKYILDMCRRWQVLYGIDGYRFDLMGILDIETMQMVNEQAKAIDPSFLVYGEGWNMPTALPENQRTTIENNHQVPDIGFFNDVFRDTLRGSNQMESKGYFSGDTYKTNDAMKAICNFEMFQNISQSINYVECHDNATCYDKFQISNFHEDEETRKKRLRLMLAAVILAQGIPFLHSGQEFFRTKGGKHNTYNAGDQINALDWNQRDLEIETVELVEKLIRLRKNNPCFRYDHYDMIHKNVKLENLSHRMIQYSLHQDKGEYQDIMVYFNSSSDAIDVNVEEGYRILYHSEKQKIVDKHLIIPKVAFAILVR